MPNDKPGSEKEEEFHKSPQYKKVVQEIIDSWFNEQGIERAIDLCNCLIKKWPDDEGLIQKKEELEKTRKEINERIKEEKTFGDGISEHNDLTIIEPIYGSYQKEEPKDENVKNGYKHYNKGNGYYKSGDYVGALQEYSMAIMFNPEFREAFFNKSIMHYRLGHNREALRELEKASKDNKDYRVLNNKACVYYQLGRYENAINSLESAISHNKEYVKAYHNLGLAYYFSAEYEKAAENLTMAIELKPNFIEKSYYVRGMAYEESEKLENAIKDYKKAFNLNFRTDDLRIRLEDLKERARDSEEMKETETLTEQKELIDAKKYLNKPRLNFSHVGGMKDVKEIINTEIIYPLKKKELAEEYGKRIGGGILLYGPPGCGKSLMAEAAAGEAGLNFIRVNINSVLNMYVGNTEKNLSLIFEEARNNQPAVLFFDEIEALGGRRERMKQHWERSLVNQFLLEMDKIEKNNYNILIVGATNMPWEVDNALRRSGRFGKVVFVGPPDKMARMEVFRIYTKGIKLLHDMNYRKLAEAAKGFSCANIKSICENAVNIPWKEAVETGKTRKVSMRDFLKVIESEKSDVKEWFEIVKQYTNDYLFKESYNELIRYMEKEHRTMDREVGMFG